MVEADVAALDTTELVKRLEGVLRDGSRSTKYLYHQAAGKRRRELLESQARASREALGEEPHATPAESRVTPLDGVLRELDGVLFGEERRRRIEKPTQIADAAHELIKRCLMARHDADSLYGVHVAQSGGFNRPSLKDASGYRTSTGPGSIADVNVH